MGVFRPGEARCLYQNCLAFGKGGSALDFYENRRWREDFNDCIGRLLHSGDVASVGEFDVPLVLSDEFFGKVGGTGARFDGSGDVVAEGSDDAKDGGRIVSLEGQNR